MGLNYGLIVSTLFQFRARLEDFAKPNYRDIILYFQRTAFDPNDEDAQTPKLDDIAKTVGMQRPRVNAIVKNLYFKLIESFSRKPIALTDHVVTLYIGYPWKELEQFKNKNVVEEYKAMVLDIDVKMPFLPRIGEQIDLYFLDRHHKFTSGHVYDITHNLDGSLQRTVLWVHPLLHSYYHHWMSLKEEYEQHQRWLKGLQSRMSMEELENRHSKGSAGFESKSKNVKGKK